MKLSILNEMGQAKKNNKIKEVSVDIDIDIVKGAGNFNLSLHIEQQFF